MSDDIFKRYGGGANTPSEQSPAPSANVTPLKPQSTPEPTPEEKVPYEAVGLNRQAGKESRLMFYYKDATLSVMSYAYLIEVISTSHMFISLIFTNCVITIKGYNLLSLLELLQDERVRALQCYHPLIHHKPVNKGQPIIVEIKRESLPEARGDVKWEDKPER